MHLYRIVILQLVFCFLFDPLLIQAMQKEQTIDAPLKDVPKNDNDPAEQHLRQIRGEECCWGTILTGTICACMIALGLRYGRPSSSPSNPCMQANSMNVTDNCYQVTVQNCGSCFGNEINSAAQLPFYNVTTAQELTQKIYAKLKPMCSNNMQQCIKLLPSCDGAKNDDLAVFINYLNQTCSIQSTKSFRAWPKPSRLRNVIEKARSRHRKKKKVHND